MKKDEALRKEFLSQFMTGKEAVMSKMINDEIDILSRDNMWNNL